MTDEHYNKLQRNLEAEMGLKKKYEGFTDCIYYCSNQCKALLVQDFRVYNKCCNYRKNKYKV